MRIVCTTVDPQSLLLFLLPQYLYRQSKRLNNSKAGLKKCRLTRRGYDKEHNTARRGAAASPSPNEGRPEPS